MSIGGLVQIAPLFWVESTIEKVKGMRPYTPLEQAGRDIYVREGCYGCHSQMIRTLRDEVERYGHYSLAAESMYDHPFQWGSKRTGPDLARVGGKYSDQWQAEHHDQSARARAGEHHAGLSLAGRHASSTPSDIVARTEDAAGWSACPTRDEMIDKAQGRSGRAGHARQPCRARAARARYPEGQGRQVRRQARRPSRPSSTHWSPTCRCSGTLVDFTTFDASGPNLR